jgi:U3 small nucleolar RNA-associated protein 18
MYGDDSNGYTAIGTESGVVNVYSHNALSKHTNSNTAAVGVIRPKPLHAVMNLTTPISCVKFNVDAQVS